MEYTNNYHSITERTNKVRLTDNSQVIFPLDLCRNCRHFMPDVEKGIVYNIDGSSTYNIYCMHKDICRHWDVSTKNLMDEVNALHEKVDNLKEEFNKKEEPKEDNEKEKIFLSDLVDKGELNVRSYNAITRSGVIMNYLTDKYGKDYYRYEETRMSLNDLENFTKSDIFKFRDLGRISLENIVTVMHAHGFYFKDEKEK